ncbi:hypothetical protein F4775DRAFT_606969 [Biscogniauxia sp. FL1348]|nr:hypothetical protein F4775DRAFT_606969 [Biscogniauxia sp. FL1348]
MEAIKRWLKPKHKGRNSSSSRPQVSSPVSGTFTKLTADEDEDDDIDIDMILCAPRSRAKHAGAFTGTSTNSTTTFVPRDRGRKATLEWLYSRTPDSVARLAQERERAARQVRRGPQNLGTFEVQDLVRQSSRRAVERLRLVRREAEVMARYGVSGAAAYNFSRSLRWNRGVVPSPQLRGFDGGGGGGAGRPPSVTVAPAGPYTPIRWLELPGPRAAGEKGGSVTPPISESGGWQDTPLRGIGRHEFRAGFERDADIEKEDVESPEPPRVDMHVERELDSYDGSPRCLDPDDIAGDQNKWETTGTAQAIAIEEIPVRWVREVYVKPLRKCHPVQLMQPIEEVSPPEERGSAG